MNGTVHRFYFCLIYFAIFHLIVLPKCFGGPSLHRQAKRVNVLESLSTVPDSAPESLFQFSRFLNPQDFENALNTPVKEPSEDDLKAMQLPNLFEGDIMGIAPGEKLLRDYAGILKYPFNSALNLGTFPDKLWPNGRVPYMLEEDLSSYERMVIAQAFDEYNEKTCIRFVPKDDYDVDYIFIRKNSDMGCSSYVGRAGGNQTVSLEIDKCFSKGIVAHELMHSLGFFHEHSRTDRDKYIKVIDGNILQGMLRNFEKYTHKIMDTMDMPYDYASVMHYHKLAFSRNGKPTIVPFDTKAEIGQRYRLSEIDAAKVNKLYNCKMDMETTTESTVAATSTISSSTSTATIYSYTSSASLTTSTYSSTISSTSTVIPTSTVESGNKSTTENLISTSTEAIKTTTTNKEAGKRRNCVDFNDHCKMWADIGHCKYSEKYMNRYCKKSCDFCNPAESMAEITTTSNPSTAKCIDQNLFCSYWAKIGECQNEAKFMKIFCKRSCKLCNASIE